MEQVRTSVRSESPFEETAGYSRAVRIGRRVLVSGTADVGPDGRARHPENPYAQTREAFQRALEAVAELGARPKDVVRTRIYIAAGADWQGPVRAHAEFFAGVNPANTTLFVAGFIPDGTLVEIELEAELSGDEDTTAPSVDGRRASLRA